MQVVSVNRLKLHTGETSEKTAQPPPCGQLPASSRPTRQPETPDGDVPNCSAMVRRGCGQPPVCHLVNRPLSVINCSCTADSESARDSFFSRAKHIMGHFKGFFEGAAPDKKIIPCTFRIRGTLVFFYVPERVRERGGERESKSESKSKSEKEREERVKEKV